MRNVIVIALLLGTTACALPRMDSFYVRGATLPEPFRAADDTVDLEERSSREHWAVPLRGHRIGPGPHTVLAFRRFSPGNWVAFDDESFEKLSIELPDSLLVSGRRFDLAEHREILVRYSHGSAVWPAPRCYGTAREGWLEVGRRSGRWLEVRLNASLDLVDCGRVELRRRLIVEQRRGGRLSPWEGRAGWTGEYPSGETFP